MQQVLREDRLVHYTEWSAHTVNVPNCCMMSHTQAGCWKRMYIILKLTTWSIVILQKLIIVTHLVKKFFTFYGTQRFITMFTRACHRSLSWTRWIQSVTSHCFSKIHSNIILQCMPTSEWYLPFRFSIQNFVHISHIPHPSHPPWFGQLNNIWLSTQIMKHLNTTNNFNYLLFWNKDSAPISEQQILYIMLEYMNIGTCSPEHSDLRKLIWKLALSFNWNQFICIKRHHWIIK